MQISRECDDACAPRLRPIMYARSNFISPLNSYNFYEVKLLNKSPQVTTVVVYRPPDDTAEQTTALFSDLQETLVLSLCCTVMTDFNTVKDWCMPITLYWHREWRTQ